MTFKSSPTSQVRKGSLLPRFSDHVRIAAPCPRDPQSRSALPVARGQGMRVLAS